MEHAGAEADDQKARLAEDGRLGQEEAAAQLAAAAAAGELGVLVGPVDGSEGQKDQHQVAECVGELGYVVADLVVALAPFLVFFDKSSELSDTFLMI